MTKRDFALLLVRLLGLYVVASSFSSLAWIQFALVGQSPSPAIVRLLVAFMPFVLQVCFGIFLWLFASAVARAMTSGLNDNEPISRWQPREVVHTSLVVIGLLCLMQGVSHAGEFITQIIPFLSSGIRSTQNIIVSVFAVSLPGFIGIILIFGARFLSFLIAPRNQYLPPDAAD